MDKKGLVGSSYHSASESLRIKIDLMTYEIKFDIFSSPEPKAHKVSL